jgi:ABC-type transporter Mla subunit MlaD
VELRGVPIGKVNRITFAWHAYPESKSRLIVVEFEVDSDLMPWPTSNVGALVKLAVDGGLRAVVKGQGITGTSILSLDQLDPALAPPPLEYKPHYYYIPSAPGQFARMLESIQGTLENLQKLDFANIGRGVTNALDAVRDLSAKIARLDLQSVSTNANILLVDLKSTSSKLQEAVGQVQETLKGMKLEAVGTNANELVLGVHETNIKLQKFLDQLGAAPVQRAVAELQQALQSLDGVLVELKRYPSGFFLGEPPLPARSVQTPKK